MPKFKIRIQDFVQLYFYIGVLIIAYNTLPNSIWDPLNGEVIATLGIVGIWRYGWWISHVVRSSIYRRIKYPIYKLQSSKLWNAGIKPKTIFFMITCYKEEYDTLKKCIDSIIRESSSLNIPVRLFFGTGCLEDEKKIERALAGNNYNLDIDTTIIRQSLPGKRVAIGLVLKAISRAGVHPNDAVVFMDSDSILGHDSLGKCLPLFAVDANIHALTTNEVPVVDGPIWVQKWFDLRFSQRHLTMQSHALAGKVITLTGRMSVFRATYITRHEFIRTIEADHLNDWIWGDFRFISGDDKSTWYYLLKQGAKMLYVPDAIVYTIDTIKENTLKRMFANCFRWSGNMLRNGSRAIALGPRKTGYFIWWCLVDQRVSVWTMLLSPTAMILASILINPHYITVYIIWIATTRLFITLVLSINIGRLDITFPFFLYANQLINAIIKVNLWFRLPKQPWLHRMNQISEYEKKARTGYALWIANFFTMVALIIFMVVVALYVNIIPPSALTDIKQLFAVNPF